ncbi:MAG: prepilin-type N-terminal cleavage/methylation domain-containing protein, partial [Planctomycetes bacterium]|nr:prepilin-type N-terminal cleavage/methylation domain-containing protein [Planctomycetota bacterium]
MLHARTSQGRSPPMLRLAVRPGNGGGLPDVPPEDRNIPPRSCGRRNPRTLARRPMRVNNDKRGLTLVEMLVSLAIIGVAAGLVIAAVQNAREVGRQAVCISHLRQILHGLSLFYMDYRCFPPDEGTGSHLYESLRDYVPDGKVFVCPADQDEASRREYRSYQGYYVYRPDAGSGEFVIGCPRHRRGAMACNLLSEGSVLASALQKVLWNGQPVASGATATGGTLTFSDSSLVALDSGYQAILVQSFKLGDGTLYSLIRVNEDFPNGSMNVTVTPGSRFEVITPAGIVGVRGTQFTSTTESDALAYRTIVAVSQGAVAVMPTEGQVITTTVTPTTGSVTMTRSKGSTTSKG